MLLSDESIFAPYPVVFSHAFLKERHAGRGGAERVYNSTNQGGDMVASTVRSVDDSANFVPVRATRGKALRAEPVAALYEQGRVHHVGSFPELEEQLCEWSPEDSGKSPDRLDALVWLVTVLLEKGRVCRSSYMPEFFGREPDHMTNWQERPPVFRNGWER